jgi:hypothetical protein
MPVTKYKTTNPDVVLITYLLIPWLHGPLRTLASFASDVHSSVVFASCLHLFTFSCHKSFSTSYSHLNLALPTFVRPSGLLQKTYITIYVWSILITCPNYVNLLPLIFATRSEDLHNSLSSWSIPVLQTPPSSVTSPYTSLKTFLSHVLTL